MLLGPVSYFLGLTLQKGICETKLQSAALSPDRDSYLNEAKQSAVDSLG